MVGSVTIPIEDKFEGSIENDPIHSQNKISIHQKFPVESEINRTRHMPQDLNIVAVKTSSPNICIFNISKACTKNPTLTLTGLKKEGYGLSWSSLSSGNLLSCSEERNICLWNVENAGQNESVSPLKIFAAHEGIVENVAWHMKNENVFGSVGNDKLIMLWDIRTGAPTSQDKGHDGDINDISFSPFNDSLFATCADNEIGIWDMRNRKTPLHLLKAHTDRVYQVLWAPFCETILASSSQDRRVCVWDLSKIPSDSNQSSSTPDDQEAPPALLFIHGGHTSRVSDFSWNPQENWTMASVDDNNVVHVWQMAQHIYDDDGDEPMQH